MHGEFASGSQTYAGTGTLRGCFTDAVTRNAMIFAAWLSLAPPPHPSLLPARGEKERYCHYFNDETLTFVLISVT